VLTARTEVTDRMLIFSERHLRLVLAQYEAHYHGRRPQSQPPAPPRPGPTTLSLTSPRSGSNQRRPILGGLINKYERAPRRSPGQDRWPSSGTPQDSDDPPGNL